MFEKNGKDLAGGAPHLEAAYLSLVGNWSLWEKSLETALQHITRAVSEAMTVSRVGIWTLDQERRKLTLKMNYSAAEQSYSQGNQLNVDDYPDYYAALNKDRFIAAQNAHADKRTSEFSARYLAPLGIGALLDATLRIAGRTTGVLCIEHVGGMRLWNEAEVHFAISVADLLARLFSYHDMRTSEARLRKLSVEQQAILDGADYSIISTDSNGIIVSYNKAAERMLGYRADELTGRYSPEIFHDQDEVYRRAHELSAELGEPIKPGFEVFVALPKRGQAEEREWTYIDKAGRRFPVRLSVTPLHDENGLISGYMGIAADLSEHKQIQANLRDSEARYRALFEGAGDSIFLLREDHLIDCNPATLRMFGCSREEIIGATPYRYSPQSQEDGRLSVDKFREKIAAAFRGETQIFEWRHMRKNGATFDAEVTLNTVEIAGTPHILATVRDISDRKRAEALLRASEEKWRLLFENMTTGFALHEVICDEKGKVVDYRWLEANPAYERLTGLKASSIIGRTVLEVLPGTEPYWIEIFGNVAQTGKEMSYENYSSELGRWFSTWSFSPKPGQFAVIISDISELKRAEMEARVAATAFESQEGMLITDADSRILRVNKAFTDITGYAADEVTGMTPRILQSGRHDDDFYKAMWTSIETTDHWSGEIWNRKKSGEIYPGQLAITAVKDTEGHIINYVASMSDISFRKKSEEEIQHLAFFDYLTDLPNRRLFMDRLEQEIKKANRTDTSFAVFFLDLDRFKEVNDTLGHGQGDALLKAASRRISSCLRETDTVARLGGDEFMLILTDFGERLHLEKIAQSILQTMVEPYELTPASFVHISASIGIALYPDDAKDQVELMRHADQAMYSAKASGKNRFNYFTFSMQASAREKMELTNDLRYALIRGELEVYYQPIVELSSGLIAKAEALLRWKHPTRGMVSPAQFIPLAEEFGLIHDIGDWVFLQSVASIADWRRRLGLEVQVSVNRSPMEFDKERFEWMDILETLGLPGSAVTMEITEGLLLKESAHIRQSLLKCRSSGIEVSIDDFGTGYSALSYLKQFDIDYLKIDQSFVRNLIADESNKALVEAIIMVAHKLGIKAIAEGVETQEQRDLLVSFACDFAQGYLYSKPVPEKEFETLIAG